MYDWHENYLQSIPKEKEYVLKEELIEFLRDGPQEKYKINQCIERVLGARLAYEASNRLLRRLETENIIKEEFIENQYRHRVAMWVLSAECMARISKPFCPVADNGRV